MPAAPASVNRQPTSAETGLRLDEPVRFQWDTYAQSGGAGALSEVEVVIYETTGVTVLWRSGLRVPEAGVCGDGWFEVYPRYLASGKAVLTSGLAVKWCVRQRDAGGVSAESTKTAFTMETANVTATVWETGQ